MFDGADAAFKTNLLALDTKPYVYVKGSGTETGLAIR